MSVSPGATWDGLSCNASMFLILISDSPFLGDTVFCQSESALLFPLTNVSLWVHLCVDQRAAVKPCWELLFLGP